MTLTDVAVYLSTSNAICLVGSQLARLPLPSLLLIALFRSTFDEAKGVIAKVPAERLAERITPQGRDVSVLEAIYQVVGHVQQHVGQIILVTKQMTAADLDLTIPRPR